MEWSEPLPYVVSGVVTLLTAWLTYRRTSKAHRDSIVIDHQKLVNETYEAVLGQLREELTRKNDAHDLERSEWEEKEARLRDEINELREKVTHLENRVSTLSRREDAVEREVRQHRSDDSDFGRRGSDPESGDDLPI